MNGIKQLLVRIFSLLLIGLCLCTGYIAQVRKREADHSTLPPIDHSASASPIVMDNGVKKNGRLHVAGTQLTNEHGEAVQLRGMSSHGLTWYPEYVNIEAMETIKGYGANLFRAAMYADSIHGGYNENEITKKANEDMMYLALENAIASDLYVIADWHILEDNNPLTLVEEAIDFFDRLSKKHGAEPGVLYEICNEPNGDTTWQDISAYAEQVIPAIRKNAPNSVIIVGTPRYSSDILQALDNPLEYENIMYTYHLYTGLSDGWYPNTLESAREGGLPVFVTEWGLSTDANTGKLDVTEAYEFIEYMKKRQISWANWSLCNKAEDFSAIKSDVQALSGWKMDDLTVSGKLIFDAFTE